VFERFTDDARKVVVYAQEECRLLRHDRIGSEHLLLALLRDGGDVGRALEAVGVSLPVARAQLARTHGEGDKEPVGHVPFTPRAKRVLEQSLRVAQRLGQEHIGRPAILRGLLEVRDATGVHTLLGLGVDVDRLAPAADDLVLAEGVLLAAGLSAGEASDGGPGEDPSRGRHLSPEGLVAEANRLAAERDRLARGLQRYGRHLQGCDPGRGCTCGLGPLLDLAGEELPDE
jgi:ATP-dependent Clp protease ATP-binding subunit ClpC